MTDDRDQLERTLTWFQPEPGIVNRVYQRRRRKQRNERLGAGVLALALAAGAVALAASAFRTRPVPVGPRPAVPQGRIAFVSQGEGHPTDRIYTIEPNGTGLRRVADVYAEYPAISPDGATVAFDSGAVLGSPNWASGTGHVFTVGVDGAGLRQVTSGGGSEFSPAWSPDGAHLAVAAKEPGTAPGIYVVDVASGAMQPVTRNPYAGYFDQEPDYTPDGARIVFVRQRALVERGAARNLAALFVVNTEGTGLHRLTPWQDGAGTPKWSPDGTRIVFRGGCCLATPPAGGALMQLFLVGADGGPITQLTSTPDTASYWPSWSPDGRSIVFTSYSATEGQPQRLYTIKPDGTDMKSLTSRLREQNEASWGIAPTPSSRP